MSRVSTQVLCLTKGKIIDLSATDEGVDVELELRFGSHAFDTNFEGVKLSAMQEVIQEMIDRGELEL